ncbi:Uncharacterised protein [Mycobacteroides abscessus subsp. abscessus]|nr:Uncharacterised protein [Mycobacteroides abscessus subsp. abscessus]
MAMSIGKQPFRIMVISLYQATATVSVTIKKLGMALSICTKLKSCRVIPTSMYCRIAWALKK